jgi:predicted amidohydrolase YtcJ
MERIDTVFFNGTLLTQDPNTPVASALAVAGERIAAVGSLDEVSNLTGPETRRIDLEGRTLIPGFNDAHVHVWKVGHLLTSMVDLHDVRSTAELQETLRSASRRLPAGEWLLGRGYNEAKIKEGRQPTRQDLDHAVSDRRVYVTRTCGHMGVANSQALRAAGIDADTVDPPGGVIVRDGSGEPTGLLQENAVDLMNQVIPEPTPGEYRTMIEAASRHQHRLGITSATDPGVRPTVLDAYRSLAEEKALRSRFDVMWLHEPARDLDDLPEPHRSDFLRFDSVKFFADGGLSGATAALRQAYRHSPTRGVMRLQEGELQELAEQAERQGFHVATHAIGDAAIAMVLSVYQKLDEERPGRRRRVEHFALPDALQIKKASGLRSSIATQPVFLHSLGENFRRYLPEAYLPRCYPLRSLLESRLEMALSSDGPVVEDDNPFLGIQAAVLRSDATGTTIAPEQSITVAQALYAYTMGGALACGDASNRGSLSQGKWADLVVLDRNPLESDPHVLSEVGVEQSYVAGHLVYER